MQHAQPMKWNAGHVWSCELHVPRSVPEFEFKVLQQLYSRMSLAHVCIAIVAMQAQWMPATTERGLRYANPYQCTSVLLQVVVASEGQSFQWEGGNNRQVFLCCPSNILSSQHAGHYEHPLRRPCIAHHSVAGADIGTVLSPCLLPYMFFFPLHPFVP